MAVGERSVRDDLSVDVDVVVVRDSLPGADAGGAAGLQHSLGDARQGEVGIALDCDDVVRRGDLTGPQAR